MSVHDKAGFAAFIECLPGTSQVEQWESLVAKVGGKVFCLLSPQSGHVAFKVSETSFAGLSALQGIAQAPYFAKGQWVAAAPNALDEPTLGAYLREAHRLIALKLTKKARAELGLAASVGPNTET